MTEDIKVHVVDYGAGRAILTAYGLRFLKYQSIAMSSRKSRPSAIEMSFMFQRIRQW